MYIPGILVKIAILSAWEKMRDNPRVTSGLKGVECGAVGLVFAAVYRLWKIGLINQDNQNGSALDNDPWFVLISGVSFISCRWFGVKPPVAIIAGGFLGMIWYGVVHPK
jgi:chromate transport protein ChrA